MSKIEDAQKILKSLGLPKEQQNEIAAFTLLALARMEAENSWADAKRESVGVSIGIMDFISEKYGRTYKPNTRETVRRRVLHQFEQARIVDYNPDDPTLPVNSPKTHYALTIHALEVLRNFETEHFEEKASEFLKNQGNLQKEYAKAREMHMVKVILGKGLELKLSSGKHNEVSKAFIEEFVPRFAHHGIVIYLGDTAEKDIYLDEKAFKKLNISFGKHTKLPDIIIYDPSRNWLYLVEVVTSHGPVSPKRYKELAKILDSCTCGLIYVTAFADRKQYKKHADDIAWETEVWFADSPTHMLHFNGDKFLGPR
ncbi:MAG: restriction endonuclease [Bacteroidetes bacterium]|nr:restriction endonuclease [Bacteroidota bacterium]